MNKKGLYRTLHGRRYLDSSSFFVSRLGAKVRKLSINAGFTCPTLDGSLSTKGCYYCDNKAFRPTYADAEKRIEQQLRAGFRFFSHDKFRNTKFLAYFQSFTNTYAPVEELERLYSCALSHKRIDGLAIGTRPDCLSDEVLDLLEQLARKHFVSLEIGIESTHDKTLKKIGRGHNFAVAENAFLRAAQRGLHLGTHLILGLPKENREMMLNHARTVSKLPIHFLKLHHLQIHRDTLFEQLYRQNPNNFQLFTAEGYLDLLPDFLGLLRPDIVMERFVSSTPAKNLIAPRWGIRNHVFAEMLNKCLKERGCWQGNAL